MKITIQSAIKGGFVLTTDQHGIFSIGDSVQEIMQTYCASTFPRMPEKGELADMIVGCSRTPEQVGRIPAIKLLRILVPGLGLLDAKNLIEDALAHPQETPT